MITLNGDTGIISPAVDAAVQKLDGVNIVERGSNANGEYVRYADGTQICWGSTSTGASGPVTWTYPVAFASSTRVIGQIDSDTTTFHSHQNSSLNQVQVNAWNNAGVRLVRNMRNLAIGRWF